MAQTIRRSKKRIGIKGPQDFDILIMDEATNEFDSDQRNYTQKYIRTYSKNILQYHITVQLKNLLVKL